MARFFIDRPIFAWVIAIGIMLIGCLSILALPVAQYPTIAPPAIAITATYPGASAKTLEEAVTQVIEQNMNGLDGLMYMASTSDASGQATITLTFVAGTNPDTAQVQVQNKLALATPRLPEEVQRQGITVTKSARNFLLVVALVSPDGSLTANDLSDYLASTIQDPLSRVEGVGEVMMFGSAYAMRIWLDPHRLNSYDMMPSDVSAALSSQNTLISAGQLGGLPAVPNQQLNATVNARGRLETPDQFRKVVLRVNPDGSRVLLSDVARVELGAETYRSEVRFNGRPASGMAIRLATGANALETVTRVRERMDQLKQYFPSGVDYVVPYDTTPFVRLSIHEVVKTLVEAIVLVFLVMYLFLQNFRATLIPTIAVPVVLLGTFGVLSTFGFSINTLTMFAMVLAIGLLVDDAIVVVENVERVMHEEHLDPREATRQSMSQITGALVGIAMVLSAVFVPMAFFGGSTGVIYRQFSITIVSAMALSVLVALTLTPALCATMLKPAAAKTTSKWGLDRFFGAFNRGFDHTNHRYQGWVRALLNRGGRMMIIYLLLVVTVGWLFLRMPTAFLPDEDQGILLTQIQLPAGATKARTMEVIKQVEHHYMVDEKDSVAAVLSVQGFSFSGMGQNMGLAFIRMRDWSEREDPSLNVQAVAGRAFGAFGQIRDAMVFPFVPPAVVELGTSNGFDLQLQDRSGLGHDALIAARNQLLGMAGGDKGLVAVRPNGLEDTPQFSIDIDTEKAGALSLDAADINSTLSAAWGSSYVNDFIDRGRVKRVYMQADAPYRMVPKDLGLWHVRNALGDMVPFDTFSTSAWSYGPQKLERYNGVPSVEIMGQAAGGLSSGEAMDRMEAYIAKLPQGIGYEWTGLSLEERKSGAQAPALYALSLLVVFLCLAALYESWSIPFSVMLVVPLGVIGALLFAGARGLSNDIYFQVGLLTTAGLTSKNAILIVEFAKDLQERGMSTMAAAIEAVRLRLRPILMTSLAFGLGVTPLALSTGAGSGSQHAIGTGVLGGMLSGTLLGLFFIPVFYFLIQHYFGRRSQSAGPSAED